MAYERFLFGKGIAMAHLMLRYIGDEDDTKAELEHWFIEVILNRGTNVVPSNDVIRLELDDFEQVAIIFFTMKTPYPPHVYLQSSVHIFQVVTFFSLLPLSFQPSKFPNIGILGGN